MQAIIDLTALDPPLELEPTPIKQEDVTVVQTPRGQQIVSIMDCDEPTRIMPRFEAAALVKESCPHKHSTMSAMRAVRGSVR